MRALWSSILRLPSLSLRLRLILLVLVGIVPLTLFSLAREYVDYNVHVEQTSREKLLLARSVTIAVDNELQRFITAMQVLAQSHRLQDGEMERFRRRAESMIAEQFPGASILLLGPDGRPLMATAVPPGDARHRLDAIRHVIASGQPVVSDLSIGAAARGPGIMIDVPVRDAAGQVVEVLSLNPPADAFLKVIEQHRPPGQWSVTLLDRQARVIARSPGGERHVGSTAAPALAERMLADREGVVDGVVRDGMEMLAAFARSGNFGWAVVVAVPRGELVQPVIASAVSTLAAGVTLLVISLGLAVWAARRIALPIGSLRSLAAKGDGEALTSPAPTGLPEADEVVAALWASRRQRQASDQRYRTLFEANPHPMCVFDATTRRFIEVNAASVRQYGWSRDEFLSMALDDTLAPGQDPRLAWPGQDTPGEVHAMRHRRRDGTVFDADVVVRFLDYNGRRVGLALAQDVTEQRLARARLLDAIQAFPGSFRLYDRDERLVLTNGRSWAPVDSGVNARIGQTAEQTIRAAADGESYAACVGRKEEWYRERLAEFRRGQTDSEVRLRDGRWLHLLERRTADGGTISLRLDITARKAIEEQLRQSQKMETVGQLTGGIAHDFNNALAVIMASFEDILAVELEGTDPRTFAETGLKATEQAAALTNRLLAFSRRQELEPVELDVASVVEDLHKMLRSSVPPAIELAVRAAPDLRRSVLDRTQLETAVMNLVVNARDAIGETGGAITIEIDNRTISPRQADAAAGTLAGEWVVLTVGDNGCGMPEKVRARIFEPFFTTKDVGEGTGLGLSQVHGFVAQSRGFVTVETVPSVGTRVALHFPALA